ncbi:MAG: response regulator transcription factor [Elusimicrobiales bacterium]|nr:response regulator transcription factor [Elusimicrobiales bacterium]
MNKMLVIDDDHIMSSILNRIFTAEKYEVKNAKTAEDGFKACLKELPDIIILDVNLPDGTGLDLCRRMKENPRIKHIPVILLTGDATSVDNKVQGIENGAEDYVLKPFITDELVARVSGILKRSFKL